VGNNYWTEKFQWIKLDVILANSLRLVLAVEFFEVEALLSFT